MIRESRLRSILRTREFADSEMKREVESLQLIVIPLIVAALVFAAISVTILPDGRQSALIALAAAVPLGICTFLARRGRPRLAGSLIAAILWAIATGNLFFGGGIAAPGQGVYFVAILMASFLVSTHAALAVTVLSLLAAGCIAILETRGALPPTLIVRNPITYWWAQSATFIAVSGLVWFALRRIRDSADDARRSERLLRLVAEGASDIIWSRTPELEYTYVSPAVETILGYTPEEMMQLRADRSFLADGRPDIEELTRRAEEEGQQVVRYETEILRKDGSKVWCEVSRTVVFDENGEVSAVTGVTRDISERKRAEQRQAELEQEFRQSQKMEAIGRLAGGIAHDFNNYLTVILGNAEMLALDSSGEKAASITEIEDAAVRSAELTQQLLAFSRKQVLQPIVLDLNRIIRDADRLLRRVLGEDISIDTVCAGGIGSVEVDPSQLEQIILNLAVNAREAMPDGGKLTIETGNVYLDAEYAEHHIEVEPGRFVMLAVSDTGVGIDAETKARIFDPFFTTRPHSGSGLGLSTVHGIVKQSGGAIEVYSELGVGTTFRIYFPRIDAPENGTREILDPILEDEERGSATVLVVEDQEMIRRLIRRMLESRGYRVFTAPDAEEALRIAETHPDEIDLLLTDIVLPGANGARLAEDLTSRFSIRVLYMSGFTENGIVHRGILDPEQLLLQKPFTAAELMRKVHEALDLSARAG